MNFWMLGMILAFLIVNVSREVGGRVVLKLWVLDVNMMGLNSLMRDKEYGIQWTVLIMRMKKVR